MGKVEIYEERLLQITEWEELKRFLLTGSNLPGPRGNLELAWAAAEVVPEEFLEKLLAFGPEEAGVGDPGEFLAFCGVLVMGWLLAEGRHELLPGLRRRASDPRWRLREAVAMSLQRLGEQDMEALLSEMDSWSRGTFLEQRAAAAALCEPSLLTSEKHATAVLGILHNITTSVKKAENRKNDEFKALRKGLGYCWSVAACACPGIGKPAMERWFGIEDKDIRWIMKQNLKKNRLRKMDEGWVNDNLKRLGA